MIFIKKHRVLLVLLAAVALLSLTPWVHAKLFVGDAWQGVPPAYGDEILYYSQIDEVARGYPMYGNPYLYEHREELPLVIFAGNWLASIPLMLGMALSSALILNFILWSLLLAVLLYWFFREFGFAPVYAALSSLLMYMFSMDLMYRPTSRQQVTPVVILFYIGLVRLLQTPSLGNAALLGVATGLTFWVFGYLWQTAVITLGLLFLYSWYMRAWSLLRGTLVASFIGGCLGLPVVLYTLYMSEQPYFWESMARLGLIDSHAPMAEVLYSGGWVGVVLVFCLLMYWRSGAVRTGRAPRIAIIFLVVTGLGMWIMEGGNLITGKLLETGEHMRRFILPWLAIALPLCVSLWWYYRSTLSAYIRLVSGITLVVLALGTAYFFNGYAITFMVRNISPELWQEQQSLGPPLAWLEEHESEPVVVWSNPHGFMGPHISALTRHYPLYIEAAIFTLVSDEELRERYLVSSFFDPVTVEYLKADKFQYLGRDMKYHKHKTIEREIKICKMLKFWDPASCGTAPTVEELLGEQYFADMDRKFAQDIKPHIKEYLAKYHVSYIVTDNVYDHNYNPESLGASLVYDDGRFKIYKL